MMWHDREHNALIYAAPNPLDIARVCPDARQLPTGHVVVPINLTNVQRLRSINLPVTDYLESWYEYPRSRAIKEPFGAQRVTANVLVANPHAHVLSDMGTGKTLASLWAADAVMRHYPRGMCRALIVCTKSTMRSVWQNEIFQNFLGKRTAVVLSGDAAKRSKLLAENHDFYIINHDGLKIGATKRRNLEWTKIAKELRDRQDIQIVIVDEARAFADATSDRSKAAHKIITPKRYVWSMTGTPTPNGPLDAYGLAKIVNGAYSESFTSYRQRVMTQVSNFKWVPRLGAQQAVAELLSPSVRFAIEDCVDLPPCTTSMRESELSPAQVAAYKEIRNKATALISGKQITAANEAVIRMKLIQIACGAVYDENRAVHYVDCGDRVSVLREVIDEAIKKVIVFAPLTSVLNMLKMKLSDEYSCEIINGAVSDKRRAEIFSAFQHGDNPRVILADPQTMAHGLTLVAATTVVWFAPTDKTENYLQANKRIHRPGQTHHTQVVQIASTPVEREIYRRLANNEALQGAILKLVEDQ